MNSTVQSLLSALVLAAASLVAVAPASAQDGGAIVRASWQQQLGVTLERAATTDALTTVATVERLLPQVDAKVTDMAAHVGHRPDAGDWQLVFDELATQREAIHDALDQARTSDDLGRAQDLVVRVNSMVDTYALACGYWRDNAADARCAVTATAVPMMVSEVAR